MATIRFFCVLALALTVSVIVQAKGPELSGVLAISSGDAVIVVDPVSGATRSHETGPVGFLFPAPSGALFAPDLVNGVTTVLDLRLGRVQQAFPGVTLPRFGPWKDRYLIVAGALTIVSYPDRSLITRMEGDFKRPWQVEIGPLGKSFLILERDPVGSEGSVLSAVDLGFRKVVARRIFEDDLLRFAVVSGVSVLAVANATQGVVRFLDPATFLEIAELPVDGGPTDVLALPDSKDLLVIGPAGQVVHWRLKKSGDGLTAKLRDPVEIPGTGARMVLSPAGDALAVVTDEGEVVIIDPKRGEVMATWPTGTTPRDFVWCDLNRRGPVLPSWTDRSGGPEEVELGPPK